VTFDDWLAQVPKTIKRYTVRKVEAYRLSLFRHALSVDLVELRMEVLTRVIRLLLKMIENERRSNRVLSSGESCFMFQVARFNSRCAD
jgi:hypothetical protein